jgi:hypothetical protein
MDHVKECVRFDSASARARRSNDGISRNAIPAAFFNLGRLSSPLRAVSMVSRTIRLALGRMDRRAMADIRSGFEIFQDELA